MKISVLWGRGRRGRLLQRHPEGSKIRPGRKAQAGRALAGAWFYETWFNGPCVKVAMRYIYVRQVDIS
jgi:hypothetical protein